MTTARSRPLRSRSRPGMAAAVLVLAALALQAPAPLRAVEAEALAGLDGESLQPRDLERGLVILIFWTTWSPRGRDIVPRVNALVRRWGEEGRVLTVNFQEDPAKVRAFLDSREALSAPVFLDERGDFSKQHRVSSAPWLLVLKDGARAFSGKLSRDPDAVIEQASQ